MIEINLVFYLGSFTKTFYEFIIEIKLNKITNLSIRKEGLKKTMRAILCVANISYFNSVRI